MFSDNLKALRKKKGFTQEELAVRINVVRQTVSKWEKGLSVPDADMLLRICEVLEVSAEELLGGETKTEEKRDEVVWQLARINEQLAVRNRRARRIWRVVGIVLISIVVIIAVLFILNMSISQSGAERVITEQDAAAAAAGDMGYETEDIVLKEVSLIKNSGGDDFYEVVYEAGGTVYEYRIAKLGGRVMSIAEYPE